MEWGRFHWLDILTRNLQKFESGQLDEYLFFYEFCKLTDLKQITMEFPVKKCIGPDLGRTRAARCRAGPVFPARVRDGDKIARRPGPRPAAARRTGTGDSWPPDQNTIDGAGSSSSPRRARLEETLEGVDGGSGPHLRASSGQGDTRERRGGLRRADRGSGTSDLVREWWSARRLRAG
jgi:hypothetical protein